MFLKIFWIHLRTEWKLRLDAEFISIYFLDFAGYYKEFVYNQDFLQASIIGNNYPLGEGNVTDNVSLAYPEGKFIEYHFPSFDPKFEGMDWESLRLIFEEMDNHWYLVGISHGQWTI